MVLTDKTFASALAAAGDKPMLVDCWAAWCGPCRMLAPIIKQIAGEARGRWIIAKLDTDQNPRTAARYNISALPTMLIFKRGAKIDEIVGLQSKETILKRLARHGS